MRFLNFLKGLFLNFLESVFGKIMPTRHQFKGNQPESVYVNLDKLISDPLPFRLHGKVHTLKPVSTKEFYHLTNSLAHLYTLRDQNKEVKAQEVIDAYYEVIKSLCDTITKEDIQKMTQAQIGAMYALILEHAHGRTEQVDQNELKKKTFQMLGQI